MISSLKKAGLIGVEAYYGSYRQSVLDKVLAFAEKYGLIPTGGSDYHGLDDNAETRMGDISVPQSSVDRLLALARERHLKFVS